MARNQPGTMSKPATLQDISQSLAIKVREFREMSRMIREVVRAHEGTPGCSAPLGAIGRLLDQHDIPAATHLQTRGGDALKRVMTPQVDREIVARRWHDVTCPEGEACRSRTLHALPSTMSDLVFDAVRPLLGTQAVDRL